MSLCKEEKNYPFNSIGEGQFYAIMKKSGISEKYTSEFDMRHLKGLNVLRAGVQEYELDNNIKIPTHASSHIDDIHFENVVELNDKDINNYLKGEAIRMELPFKGYCKVLYKNLGVGIAKYVNGILKNHLPKGLRIL